MVVTLEGYSLALAVWYLCGVIGIATVTMIDEREGIDTASFPEGLLASLTGGIALAFSIGCLFHYYLINSSKV